MVEWGKENEEEKNRENGPKSDISSLFSSIFFSVKGRTLYLWYLKYNVFMAVPVCTIPNRCFQTSEQADLDQESAKYLDIMQIM